MSTYFKKNGKWLKSAGSSSELVYGASTIRKGTFTVAANTTATVAVTFDSPMPDADYVVEIYNAGTSLTVAHTVNKTVNGFTVHYINTSSDTYTVSYTAFKLYTVEDVAESQRVYKKLWQNNLGPSGLSGTIEAVRCGNVVSVKVSGLRKANGANYVPGDPVTTASGDNRLLDYALPLCATNMNDGTPNDNTHFILHGNGRAFILATCYVQHDNGYLRAEMVYGDESSSGGLFSSITYITDDNDYDYSDWEVIA